MQQLLWEIWTTVMQYWPWPVCSNPPLHHCSMYNAHLAQRDHHLVICLWSRFMTVSSYCSPNTPVFSCNMTMWRVYTPTIKLATGTFPHQLQALSIYAPDPHLSATILYRHCDLVTVSSQMHLRSSNCNKCERQFRKPLKLLYLVSWSSKLFLYFIKHCVMCTWK